jgi:hypothetical protein
MKLSAEQVRLFLLPEVEERMRHYTRLARGEVSGLGLVEEFDGGFLVTDLFLPKQECSASSTTLCDEAVATLLLELDRSGRDPAQLKFWFHSHGSMNVFWSNTDQECIEDLANGDYLLSLVTNKRGDMLARLDIYKPARVTVDDVSVSVRSRGESQLETCQKEIQEKVKDLPVSVFPTGPMTPRDRRDSPFLWGDDMGLHPGGDSVEWLEQEMFEGNLTVDEYEHRLAGLEGRNEY